MHSPIYRDIVLSGEDEDLFFNAFCMTKEQFDFIVDLIKDHSTFARRGKKPQKSVEIQLKVALHRLAHNGTLTSRVSLSGSMDVSVGSVGRYTRKVTNALCAHVTEYIKWPSPEEKVVIKRTLGKGRFPDLIGAVDGTMIPIYQAPSRNRDALATQKGNYALGATAVCDHRGVFTFIHTGYAGSRHDAAAYKDTPLYREKEHFFTGEDHLVGDSAYALTPTVLTAFKGKNQPPDRDRFNKQLRSSRVTIEHAFGWLKGKFPCLNQLWSDYAEDNDMHQFNNMVLACAVIYNILKTQHFQGDNSSDDEDNDSNNNIDMEDGDEYTDNEEEEEEHNDAEYAVNGGDVPWHEFETAAERGRYETMQRVLGERKREQIKAAIEAKENN